MPVQKSSGEITLICGTCNKAKLSLKRKEVVSAEWTDNHGWKTLRQRAYSRGWRISASENGAHYCPKCIAAYDF